MATKSKQNQPTAVPIHDVEDQLAAISKMPVKELQALWQELYGVPSLSRNRPYLQRRLTFRVQELAEGGLSKRAQAKASELQGKGPGPRKAKASDVTREATPVAPRMSKRERDPRLPKASSVLEREHKGEVYTVTVHDSDFEYAGKRFGSLSTIAREITGQVWNGYLFWGLIGRGAKKGAA